MAPVEDTALPVEREALCDFKPHGVACTEPAVYTCRHCGKAYCIDHASDIDPRHFCIECLKPAEAKLVQMPLLDAEGTTHPGRLLRPYGKAWGIFDKYIEDMSDEELRDSIKEYQALLHDLESAKNFVQINLSKMLSSAVDRTLVNAKKSIDELGRETIVFQTPKKKAVKMGKAKPSTEDKLVEAMAKLLENMSPEQLAAFLAKRKKKA